MFSGGREKCIGNEWVKLSFAKVFSTVSNESYFTKIISEISKEKCFTLKDPVQILSQLLSKFEQINYLVFPLKIENLWFKNYIRSKIW